jgi:hypothetical protein
LLKITKNYKPCTHLNSSTKSPRTTTASEDLTSRLSSTATPLLARTASDSETALSSTETELPFPSAMGPMDVRSLLPRFVSRETQPKSKEDLFANPFVKRPFLVAKLELERKPSDRLPTDTNLSRMPSISAAKRTDKNY